MFITSEKISNMLHGFSLRNLILLWVAFEIRCSWKRDEEGRLAHARFELLNGGGRCRWQSRSKSGFPPSPTSEPARPAFGKHPRPHSPQLELHNDIPSSHSHPTTDAPRIAELLGHSSLRPTAKPVRIPMYSVVETFKPRGFGKKPIENCFRIR